MPRRLPIPVQPSPVVASALTREEAANLAEKLARSVLAVSGEEAFDMLDRGELQGTAVEAELRMLRFLLG